MKRAAEHAATPPAGVANQASPSASRFDRLLRTLAFLALGPTLVLATPMRLGTASLLASLVLAGSLLAAHGFPRLFAPRLGRVGAFFATSLLLGLVGTLLGFLDGCSIDAARCRSAVGAWTFTWLLIPAIVLAAGIALKTFQALPRVAFAPVRRLRDLLRGRPGRR